MGNQTSDVIVVGAGVMGCATAYHLARDGARVLLLDQFAIGHAKGSSHGPSRIFRLAYDKLEYIELARAAYQMWRDLEVECHAQLLQRVGGLDLGTLPLLENLRRTMQFAGVEFELLECDELFKRFPQFVLPEDTAAL